MTTRQTRSSSAFSIARSELSIGATTASGSLVDQIFTIVAAAIQSRKLSAGARMASVRQLADDCGVSRDTAARAYDKLVAHGRLESRPGSGYFVKVVQSRRAPERAPERPSLFHPRRLDALTRFKLNMLRPHQELIGRCGQGHLPEDWLDEAGIAGALRSVARGSQRVVCHYGDPQGYLPLRQQLQGKLHDMGVHTEPSNIIVTSGATDALHLIATAFLRTPGERVLLEQPCQPLLPDRLLSVGLDFAYVPQLADGPDLTVLRAMCEQHRPRFYFCSSALQNPTSTSLAPHKAFQMLRLADEFDLTLVEDDTYCDLAPQGHGAAPRLAALDQLQRVIYVSSFSKTMAPGLRVGYLAASAERVAWMTTHRAINSIASSHLAERMVYRLLTEGNYRHHCEQLRTRLVDVRADVVASLRSHGFHIEHDPLAGLYVWADLGDGVDAFPIAQRMLDAGHLVAPGQVFARSMKSHMRFNVATTLNSPSLPMLRALVDETIRA